MTTGPTLKIIDLFAGAGGLTSGFVTLSSYPFVSVWANDFNKYAAETYNANFSGPCVCGDIVDILSDPHVIPEADIVIGGPPCQGFSLLNKKRENDPRKKLWMPFMEVVERSNARTFVMENVPQLIGSVEFEEIVELASDMGFTTWSGILLATDYGVPQLRRRAVIVGSKDADPNAFFPMPKTHIKPGSPTTRPLLSGADSIPDVRPWRTIRDAIGDLPPPVGTGIRNEEPPLDLHFGRSPTPKSLARYRAIPEEGMNRFDLQKRAPELTPDCWIRKKSGGTDLFGRLWWDRPAFTIRTEFFKPEKGRYLHPAQHRPITHREAARIQTFPDTFRFKGSKTEIARQIGNAVPPLLAARIADRVYEMILSAVQSEHVGCLSGVETPRDHVPRSQ